MIAKINLDGNERLAIVFNEFVSLEEIQQFKTALNSCMQLASQDDERKNADDFYWLHSLMEEMELTPDQIHEMFRFYFGKKDCNIECHKSTKKLCEIYL